MEMLLGQEAKLGALLVGAILAGMLTVGMVGFVTRVSRLKEDTAIGIMYTGIFAFGAMVVSIKAFGERIHVDIYHYILGSVISVSDDDMWLLAGVTAVVLSVIILFYRQLQLTSFDPIMAASIGIPVLLMDYLLTACASLVVVSGVQIVGVILVIGLIITPAASAYLLTDRLNHMILTATTIGVVGFWLGFLVATLIGADPGAAVVVTMTCLFLLTLVFAPKYGLLADWVRKSNMVPQEVMEDVLGAILRESSNSVAIASVLRRVETGNHRIRRAIKKLARQDLIRIDGDSVELTDDGRREAKRLVRAHRLWETYLEKSEATDVDIHRKAHELEHISDQETVDYLDDKLGHPLTDPHGTTIPEDAHQLEGTGDVKASYLREGYRAEVRSVLFEARSFGFVDGETITMGPRSNQGATWVIKRGNGQLVELNHDQADAVIVRVVGSPES